MYLLVWIGNGLGVFAFGGNSGLIETLIVGP